MDQSHAPFAPRPPVQKIRLGHKPATQKAQHRKGEYRKKLEETNQQLKEAIAQYEQSISAKEAENEALKQQLEFFRVCLPLDHLASPS
jgi:predicted RNase H-like nuclease (RuvC/YqgF family)